MSTKKTTKKTTRKVAKKAAKKTAKKVTKKTARKKPYRMTAEDKKMFANGTEFLKALLSGKKSGAVIFADFTDGVIFSTEHDFQHSDKHALLDVLLGRVAPECLEHMLTGIHPEA